MKRLLCALLAALILAPAAYAQPLPGEIQAASAVLVEKETGAVLYEKAPHERLEPASVTKIMTLLLVFEALEEGRISLNDLVSTSAHAAGMGGSQVFLKEGEQMDVGTLIKCVTVVSGNDAAVALAEHVAGSEEAFVTKMNAKAAQLGMNDTTFLNCTGLPAQGHLTSANDISLMSRALILNHPEIRDYTTIWMDAIRDGAFGLTNTNRLVRFYQGATGLKTGSTDGALYCMSATAQRDGMELIAVVMKSPTSAQRFEDAKTLLDFGFAHYTLTDVYPEIPLPPVPVLLGEEEQVQPMLSAPCRLLLQRGEEKLVETRTTLAGDVEAPVEEGQSLGQLEVLVDGQLRHTVPLTAQRGVERMTVGKLFGRMLARLTMQG